MSFNTSTFNQNGFNLTSYKGLELIADGYCYFDCICKVFDKLYFSVEAKETFNAECRLSRGRLIECSGLELFDFLGKVESTFNFDEDFTEIFESEVSLSYDLNMEVDDVIKVESENHIASIIGLESSELIKFEKLLKATKLINYDLELTVYFDAIVDVENVEERIFIINVTIPPGKKLIIDAKNYTAYLDNVNILDRVSGDWPDEIERDTNAILITCSNSTALKTTMLYEELYL